MQPRYHHCNQLFLHFNSHAAVLEVSPSSPGMPAKCHWHSPIGLRGGLPHSARSEGN